MTSNDYILTMEEKAALEGGSAPGERELALGG
jgi:hypothetical protein